MTETMPLTSDNSRGKENATEMSGEGQPSQAGFKVLYQQWLTPVYRYFYYRVGEAKDAEDLTAQVFLKVYEELPRYRDRGAFPAWLFAVVRNKAADHFRSRRFNVSLESVDLPGETRDLLALAAQTDEIRRLNRLIRSLPEEEQELIRLRFVAGLGYKEIGAILHRKEDTVRKTTSRLLARLQSQLEESHE